MHPSLDHAISAVASRQYGLVTSTQLEEIGIRRQSVAKRIESGRIRRVHRGVYAVGHPEMSEERRWMAAVLAAGPGAALSHLSAGKLWQICRVSAKCVHVVAPRQRRNHRDIRVHFSRILDRRDITTRRGIPVTTVARTVVDLADVLDAHQLANVMHEASYRNLLNVALTREVIERVRGRQRLGVAEAALELHLTGSSGSRSMLESRGLSLVDDAALPYRPEVNVRVEGIEVDLLWRRHKLVVELDGPAHSRARTRREDALRDRLLRAAGYEVLRFTAPDLDHGGERFKSTLRERIVVGRRRDQRHKGRRMSLTSTPDGLH